MKKNLFLVLSITCLTLSFNSVFAVFSVSLTPSNHNGYSISCFGGVDGAINITVTGGTSPYTYRWSTGATTQNVSALAAGYYQVTVTDVNSATCTGNVTLTQPTAITLSVTPSIYSPQTTNISCYNCCNGYINISVGGGVASYSYAWSSGQTTANVTNLCKNSYTIIVTDANGCSRGEHQVMTEPDKDTWTMTGNGGSNPSSQFIGTTDAQDLSFRSNNVERLRIKSNGNILFKNMVDTPGYSPVVIDSLGQIHRVNQFDDNSATSVTQWMLGGNYFLNSSDVYYLGTQNNRSLVFKTNANNGGGEWMRITPQGKIGIGLTNPFEKLQVTDGTVYIQGEDQGLIVDAQTSKRVGFMKYSGREAGIWRTSSQDFEIGRVNVSSLNGSPTTWRTDLYIDGNGKTFIGFGLGALPCTGCAGSYKLYVEGGIMTRDVKVTATTPFPDFVFSDDYKSMSIHELEQFIKQNRHLPGIPTAQEIEKNEGYELGDMVQKLLKKTEEQTLYIIDQQKQIDELNAKVKKLSKR